MLSERTMCSSVLLLKIAFPLSLACQEQNLLSAAAELSLSTVAGEQPGDMR